MTSIREHWQKVYDRRREDEVSWHQASPITSLDLISRTGAGRDARVVDVGGGASRLVDALIEKWFEHVTVVDIADAPLELARKRLGDRASRVTWVTSDVGDWAPDGPYDVWHDRAVFHFMVRPEDRAAYLSTLRSALRSGGHLIIGTFASNGPDRCSALPVMRYEPETLAAELGPDFRLLEGVRAEHVTPAGKVQQFQFSRFVRI
ncbi:class I SAM-dependent methyltransferase [Anaeromyxobacter oryzae]|uniref:Methyltransferase domain-containing protein n=1 Tax=Anaeromyxobacter oryzae TaxID=2918170 RepID=A0ABN6MQ30_9BACT|nr:class I SAM-dependent methyltransferase [Anaeromyxobacter oryzae]BDG03117.1 hypothetical protein AMOR_21130 [Anaeromyxobacter oryzae]